MSSTISSHHATQASPGSTNTTLSSGNRSNTPPMIHIPNASAVMRGVMGTITPMFGVGSLLATSSSVVLSPMWQHTGSPDSSMVRSNGTYRSSKYSGSPSSF